MAARLGKGACAKPRIPLAKLPMASALSERRREPKPLHRFDVRSLGDGGSAWRQLLLTSPPIDKTAFAAAIAVGASQRFVYVADENKHIEPMAR